ncbi:hypothetical protein SAMD00019534_018560 [Acytostelium subglobosum LB1]|uniref:hypothetical protein n=1 Tax=Acytostelium subglobosum LB1 TaxID=1410327 RepID=UPI000644C741|nr:hypothetical protein SAMD00019534_018560 [Acytostelium subglobosum LB1]GAM18681.1 hypothetical protein SAMD00019534_018560 [Acytostelium subglobosum LB1]|eukprot:XP_012757901.1 hypothetical protein SAMD00019534_018560 [Acytostelium subglobosum LB1]
MSNYNSNLLFNTQITYEDNNSTFVAEPIDEPYTEQTPVVIQQKISSGVSDYPEVQTQYASHSMPVSQTSIGQPTPHNSMSFDSLKGIPGGLTDFKDKRTSVVLSSTRNQSKDITVREPEKVGDGVGSYVTYKVYTIDILADRPDYKKENTVVRRYSDFEWLRNSLKETRRGIAIPTLPEKAVLNKFNKEFLEIRRRELEKFLNRIAENDALMHSNELTIFLEGSDEKLAAARNTRPVVESADGTPVQQETKTFGKISSFFGSAASAVSNMTSVHSVKEVDPWFDDKKIYIVQLDNNLRRLTDNVSNVIRKRRELAQAMGDFSSAGLTFSSGEISQSQDVANSFQRITQVESTVKSSMDELSNSEANFFEDGMIDYIRVLNSIKELLNERLDALLNFQNWERKVESAREKFEKLKAVNAFKKDSAQKEYEDYQKKLADAKQEFERVSATTKVELQRFDNKRNYELKRIVNFVIRLNLEHYLKAADCWREYYSEQNQDIAFDTNKASWGITPGNLAASSAASAADKNTNPKQ